MNPPNAEMTAPQGDGGWPALWFAQDASARVIVSRDLAVLSLNQKASSLLSANGAIAIRDGCLSARDRRLSADLYDLVADAGPARVSRALGTAGSSLLVEAVALDGDAAGPVGLMLRDLAGPIEIVCADLEPMFGVTPGEHGVVVQLLKGHSSREIADASGKSVLTVRTHVKRAYGKIGVKTRGQLFARLLPYLSIR
jgi:DNA-binding CsgD family transcriptional regulator